MPPLPTPVRAAIGLAASLLDEARHLPDKAIELPMVAVSRALQLSLRAQQRYAGYAARGDELLAGRFIGDEPPAWATFDDPVADDAADDAAPVDVTGEPGAATTAATERAPVQITNNTARRPARGTKTVRAPRTGAPSAFDAVPDEADDTSDDQ